MIAILREWPSDRLEALYRCYKRTGFFNDPRDVIQLRELVHSRRNARKADAAHFRVAAE